MAMALPASAQQWDNYKSLLRDQNVYIDKTNLPIVFIDVNRQEIQRNSQILGHMKIVYNGAGKDNYEDTVTYNNQKIDYEGPIAIKYRGHSSFDDSDKKPYAIKTLKSDLLPDQGGKKDKVKLLGMGKDNDWVLLAPFSDKSMMRDVMTFDLARKYMDWTPECRYCEVILDGTYYGVYILTGKPGKGSKRLNLDDPGSDDGDLSGGYLVQIDRNDDPYYASKYRPLDGNGNPERDHTIKYQYESPGDDDFESLPAGTRDSLQASIDSMEASFTTSYYADPVKGYRSKIDVQSFIDYMLATEFSGNIDGYRLSTYYYKYSNAQAKKDGLDPRWKMTLWDFNIAYGNANYYNGNRTNFWQYDFNGRERTDAEHVPFYWSRMLQDTAYVSQLKARWAEYRSGSYSDEHIDEYIDSIASLLKDGGAVDRNQRAYQIIGRSVWPNAYVGRTYDDEVEYLKSWIKGRLSFMDKKLLASSAIKSEPVDIAQGWNADVIAESRSRGSYNNGIDGSRPFYSASVQSEGGLPQDRQLTTDTDEGIHFRFADYVGSNALNLNNGETGVLKFENNVKTDSLYILATSGNGTTGIDVTVDYTDGTHSQAQRVEVPDWSDREPDGTEAVSGLGRIDGSSPTTGDNSHYALYYFLINSDAEKEIESLTISSEGSGIANVLGVSRVVKPVASGIANVAAPESSTEAIYTVDGIRIPAPRKGLNIIKKKDGTTQKVVY